MLILPIDQECDRLDRIWTSRELSFLGAALLRQANDAEAKSKSAIVAGLSTVPAFKGEGGIAPGGVGPQLSGAMIAILVQAAITAPKPHYKKAVRKRAAKQKRSRQNALKTQNAPPAMTEAQQRAALFQQQIQS